MSPTVLILTWSFFTRAASFEVQNITQGVLFDNFANLTITSDEWTTVLHFNITKIETAQKQLVQEINQIQSIINLAIHQNVNASEFNTFQKTLESEMSLLDKRMSTFKNLIPKSPLRMRRALELVGDAWKTLFGTMNADDSRKINEQLKTLKIQSQGVFKDENKQLIIIKDMEKSLEETTNHVLKTAEEINTVKTEINKIMTANTVTVNNELQTLFLKSDITKNIEVLCFQISQFHENLDQLINGMLDSLHGNLSPFLVPTTSFKTVLKQIQASLKGQMKMIWPVRDEFLGKYYKTAKVTARQTESDLLIGITLPITTVNATVKLVKIINYKVFWPKIQHYVTWDMHEYMIIDETKNVSYIPNENDVRECLQNQWHICAIPISWSTLNNPTCESTMYFKHSGEFCQRRISDKKEDTAQKTSKGWLISQKEITFMSITCADQLPVHFLAASNILLSNVKNCAIVTKSLTILPHTKMTSSKLEELESIKIPNLTNIVGQHEDLKMINLTQKPDLLQHIQTTIQQEKSITFEKLETHVQNYDAETPIIDTPSFIHGGLTLNSIATIALIIAVVVLCTNNRNVIRLSN